LHWHRCHSSSATMPSSMRCSPNSAEGMPFGNAWCWELKPDLKPGEVFSLVTSQSQAQSYLRRARGRLKALAVLRDEGDHSDVVREAQELVELALKGMLRAVGVEPPKFHDVGRLLVEYRGKFSTDVGERLDRAAQISARLRRERELAFYGDIDFVPSEQYSAADAARAYDEAAWIVALAEEVIGALPA